MTFYRHLKLYIFMALIFSLGSVIYFPSYYNTNLTETISYYVSDSWCPQSEDSIGYHCFGDFYYIFTVANSQNPWATSLGIPYLPLSVFPFLIPISSFSYLNSPNSLGLISFSKFGGIFVLMSFVLISLNIIIRSIRSTIAND